MNVPGEVFGLNFCWTLVSLAVWTFGRLVELRIKEFVITGFGVVKDADKIDDRYVLVGFLFDKDNASLGKRN